VPVEVVRSLCNRGRFSSPNAATEATTPPFCIVSLRLYGFCIPCGQPRAETLDFPNFDEILTKRQKVLFGMFRSILSNSEATLPAPLIAGSCVSNERFRFH
jgi:hypothetical protein